MTKKLIKLKLKPEKSWINFRLKNTRKRWKQRKLSLRKLSNIFGDPVQLASQLSTLLLLTNKQLTKSLMRVSKIP